MDFADDDDFEEATFAILEPRPLSGWDAVAVVFRGISRVLAAIADAFSQFAYLFYGKAEYDEARKRFAAEAGRSIETITGGE